MSDYIVTKVETDRIATCLGNAADHCWIAVYDRIGVYEWTGTHITPLEERA